MPTISVARFRNRKPVRDDRANAGSLGGCVSVDEIVNTEESKDDRSTSIFQRSKSHVESKSRFGRRAAMPKDTPALPSLPNQSSSRVDTSRAGTPLENVMGIAGTSLPFARATNHSSSPSTPVEDAQNQIRPKTADASIGGHRSNTVPSLSSLPPLPQPERGRLGIANLASPRPSSSNDITRRPADEVFDSLTSHSSPESPYSRRNRSEASLPLVAKSGTKYSFTPSLNTPDNQRSSRASAINARAGVQAARIARQASAQVDIAQKSPTKRSTITSKESAQVASTGPQNPGDVTFSATITGFGGSEMYWDSFDPSYYEYAESSAGSEHGDSTAEKEVVEQSLEEQSPSAEPDPEPPSYAAELDSLPIAISSNDDDKAVKQRISNNEVTDEPLSIVDAKPVLPEKAPDEPEISRKHEIPDILNEKPAEQKKDEIKEKPGFGHARKQSQAARELKDARLKILSLNLSQHHAEPSLEQFAQRLLDKLSPTSAHFLAQNMALPASPDPSELSASPISPRGSSVSSPLVTSKSFGQVLDAKSTDKQRPRKALDRAEAKNDEKHSEKKEIKIQSAPGKDALGITLSIDTALNSLLGPQVDCDTPIITKSTEDRSPSASTGITSSISTKAAIESTLTRPGLTSASSVPTITASQSLPPTPIEQPFAVPIAIAANLNNLKAAFDSQKRKAASLTEENETLRTQLTAVLKKMAESDTYRLERDRSEKQHKETKAKLKLLEDELTELKAGNQTTLNRYEAMQAKLDEAHEQKLDVLEENHELHTKVKSHETTVSTLEARIRSIHEEESKAKAEKVKDISQAYEQTIVGLEDKLNTIRSELKELQGRPEKSVLQASEKKNAGLVTELKALQEVTAELMLRPEKKLLDALERKSKTLYERNKVVQSEKKALEGQIIQLEEQVVTLEEQTSELKAKPDLGPRVAELTSKLKLLEQDIQDKSSQVLKLQMHKVQLEQLVSSAEAAVTSAEAKVLEMAATKKIETKDAITETSTEAPLGASLPEASTQASSSGTNARDGELEKKIKKLRAERDKFEQLLHAEFRRNALEMHDRKHPLAKNVAKKIDMDQATKSLRQRAEMAIAGMQPGGLPKVTKERSASSNHILSQLAVGESSEQAQKKPEDTIRDLEAEIAYYLTDIVLFKLDVRGYKKDLRKAQDKIKQLGADNDGIFRNSAGDEVFEMPAMPLTPERRSSIDEASISAEPMERGSIADRIVSAAPSDAITEIIIESKPGSIAEQPLTGTSLDFGNPFGPPLNSPTFSTASGTQSSSSTVRNGSVASTAPSELTQATQLSGRESSTSMVSTDASDSSAKLTDRNDRALLPSQKARQRDMAPPVRTTGLRKAGSLDEIVTNPGHVRNQSGSAKAAAAMGLSIALGPRSTSASVLIGSPLSSVTSANSPSTDGVPSPFTTSPPPSAQFYTDSQHHVVNPSPILTPPMTLPNTPTLLNTKSSDASLGCADEEKILVEPPTPSQEVASSIATTAQSAAPLLITARKVNGPTLIHQSAQHPADSKLGVKDPVQQVREVERSRMARSSSPSPLRSHPATHMVEKPSIELERRVALANGTAVNRPGSAASGKISNSPRKYGEEVGRASQDTVQSEASALMELMTVAFMPATGA